jgi:hypothetical protein
MFKESHGVATQHTTHYEATIHRPAQVSKEATPGSDNEASFNDAAHRA